MIESDLARQVLLVVTALTFVVVAVRTVAAPDVVAAELGYALTPPNGPNELFAVYVGVWLASAGLALLAAARVETSILGDAVAALVLAQPVGRSVAAVRWGWPRGPLRVAFALEVVAGLAIVAVRPSR